MSGCRQCGKTMTTGSDKCTCGITGPLNCPRHRAKFQSARNKMNNTSTYGQTHYKSGIDEPAKIWIGENGAVKVRAPYQASFVAYAKQFPGNKRRWLKEANIWEFEYELLPEVLALLRKFYSNVITLNIGEERQRAQEQQTQVSNGDAWSELHKLLDKADLDSIYRALAKKNHPDAGGNKVKMGKINELFSKLRT